MSIFGLGLAKYRNIGILNLTNQVWHGTIRKPESYFQFFATNQPGCQIGRYVPSDLGHEQAREKEG